MPTPLLLALDMSSWGPWAAPAIGILFGLLVACVGYALLGLRHANVKAWPAAPAVPTPPPESGYDPFLDGTALERRYGPRRKGNAVPVQISNEQATAEPCFGWVIDRSVGGLRLSVDQPVTPATILSVRTTDAPESTPWVQVEVRNCAACDKNWELGCRFVRTPAWSILLLFG
jgi:hypothetical protein